MNYYEIELYYVDDVLALSHDPMNIIYEIQKIFKLKRDKATVPRLYLECSVDMKRIESRIKCWTLSSSKYMK